MNGKAERIKAKDYKSKALISSSEEEEENEEKYEEEKSEEGRLMVISDSSADEFAKDQPEAEDSWLNFL